MLKEPNLFVAGMAELVVHQTLKESIPFSVSWCFIFYINSKMEFSIFTHV
jgi:hypothetical protein